MTCKLLDAGNVQRTITRMRVQDGGTLRNIVRMKVLDGVTLRTVATFATPLSLSISPSGLYKESFTGNVIVSDPATASPSGGLGPYSYSWAIIAGTATISHPTSATTYFTSPVLIEDAAPEEATARCTCTDSSGQTATANVTTSFYFFNPL